LLGSGSFAVVREKRKKGRKEGRKEGREEGDTNKEIFEGGI